MAIADNLICQVYPVTGDTSVKNIVDNSTFSGTGSPTLVTEGADKAWSVTTGTLLEGVIPSKQPNGSTAGSGITIAVRFKATANGSGADFLGMFGIKPAASSVDVGPRVRRNGNNSYAGRVSAFSQAALTSMALNTVHTIVFRVSISSTDASDVISVWQNKVGRVGTSPDAVSAVFNYDLSLIYDRAFINCQNSVAFTMLDFAYWSSEKTEADCAAIADNYRTVMPAPSGGSTPISFSGTIPTQTFTNGQVVSVDLSSYFTGSLTPFTFTRTGTALTGTGLSINSSGILVGTATTGSVTGVTITGTDAGSNTAVSNAFNVTVNAVSPVSFNGGPVPDQIATVGTLFTLDLSTYFTGSLTPFSYALTAGNLTGTGLSLNTSTGIISGTPTSTANLDLQVRATDTGTNTAVTNLIALDINAAATPVSFTGTIPAISGTQNSAITPVNTSTYFSGSLTPFTYSLFSGTLPSGVTLNSSTGIISGTPTVSFTGNIVVRATDTGSNVANSNSISINIAAATSDGTITLSNLKNNTATPLASISGFYVTILSSTNPKSVVYNTASISSNASAVITFTNASIVQGTEYRYFIEKDGVAFAAGKVTAT